MSTRCFEADGLQIECLLDKAQELKLALAGNDPSRYRLAGNRDMIIALLFYENSTRTRTSFEIAALRLGIRVVGFAGTESPLVSVV